MVRAALWFCRNAARHPREGWRGCAIVSCLLARDTQGFQQVYPLLALDLEATQAVDQGLLGLGGGGEVGGDAARSIAIADLVKGLPPASHGLGLIALALVVDCCRACEVALIVSFLEKGGWRFSAAQHGDARMLPTSRSTWALGWLQPAPVTCCRRLVGSGVAGTVLGGCSWWGGLGNCENGCAAGQDSRHCIRDESLGVRIRPSMLGDALSRNDVQGACLCRGKEGGCQQPQVTSMGRCWGVSCPAGDLRIPCWTTRHTQVMRENVRDNCPLSLSF